MTCLQTSSSFNIWLYQSIFLCNSLYSSCSLSCIRPVNWLRRISTIAFACTSSNSKRFINASCADWGVLDARIICTTSSMLSLATIKASKMCCLSCAFFKSNFVRRITTSWRCTMKLLIQSFNVSSLGRPWTNAMQLTLKLDCNAVILNNLFRTTLAFASRFTSITMRIPSRSDSSLTLLIPSIRFSTTKWAISLISSALLTP